MTHPPHPIYVPDDDWKWLQSRPGGASATVRKLVSEARGATTRKRASGPTAAARLYAELAKRGDVRPSRAMMLGWLTGPVGQAHLRAFGVSVDEALAEWDRAHNGGGAISASPTIARSEGGMGRGSKPDANPSGSTSTPPKPSAETRKGVRL